MTNDGLRGLALRLAKDAGMRTATAPSGNIGDYVWGEPVNVERLVRAAVAHGLRMGAEVCDMEEDNDMTGSCIAQECAATLRAKADEMERGQ